MHKAPSGTNWEFAGFKVMTRTRQLIADGILVPLTSKAFDTLVVLIENRDRVVTKDELLNSVWPDAAVEEGNLTQQIFLLRKALGETAQEPRHIVTVPGHGYRFTARVNAISDDPAATAVSTNGSTSPPAAPRRSATFIAPGLAVFGVIALAFALGSRWMSTEEAGVPLDLTRNSSKITESGKAWSSAISRDGRYVAWVENDGDQYSLWSKQLGSDGTTPVIPRGPSMLSHLSFSPDGQYVYFTRDNTLGGFLLSRVPVLGGPESPILNDVDSAISFSPDGRKFVFQRGAGTENHIVIADALGGSQRILATRKPPFAFSVFPPGWSPDGKVVAASVLDTTTFSETIVLLPVDSGGSSRDFYTSDKALGGLRWLPDGSGLLIVISESVEARFSGGLPGGAIWRIAYPSGRAERLTSDLADHDLCCLDVGANGSAVVSLVNTLVSDLWMAPAGRLDERRQLTWGHPVTTRHSWLPDNTIVYRDLSGRLSVVHRDGREFNLPLPDGHKTVGGVSVCGDGRYVVFQAVPGNNIWRVTPNAGGPVRLTSGPADFSPACSPDGKWVLYSSLRLGRPELWRISIDGREPAPLIQDESWDALPSPSGRLIYYAGVRWQEGSRQGRWIVISSSDRKILFNLLMPDGVDHALRPNWAPDESGLDYVVTRNGVSNVWRQLLTGGSPAPITRFSSGRIFSFAWSPDGQWLSFGAGVSRSDVVVMSSEP